MSSTAALALPRRDEEVRELRERIHRLQQTKLDDRGLPTHPALARLLPGGALQEGATYSIDRSLFRFAATDATDRHLVRIGQIFTVDRNGSPRLTF